MCLAVVVALTAGLLLASTARAQQSQPPPIVIRDIHVEGNRRVQDAVILGRVKSIVGSVFNPSLLAEDIRSIFSLGFFDDVQMRVEDFEGGVKVVFIVSERPFIRDVDFVGNKKQDRETLQEKIELKLGSVYNPVEVQRAVEKLRDFYEDEGYFEVQITPTVEKFASAFSALPSANTYSLRQLPVSGALLARTASAMPGAAAIRCRRSSRITCN